MSYKLCQQVIEHSRATGLPRLALITLADIAHPDGTGRITSDNWSKRARMSGKELLDAAAVLARLGELDYKPDGRFSITISELQSP